MQFANSILCLLCLFAPNVISNPIEAPAVLGSKDAIDQVLPRSILGLQEVQLRVEGRSSTIFEGIVLSKGHNITTASGGTHHCDGTNNGANPSPGNTPTTSLDTAAKLKGFTFDGTYSATFDDYFITSIGPDTQTSTEFWGLLVNFQFTPVGGCQFITKTNDKILWAFNAFNVQYFLKLDGKFLAKKGKPFTLTVTDGSTGIPLQNAVVTTKNGGGASGTTDANGNVQFTLSKEGIYKFKAERSDSIRSNAVIVTVL